MTEDKKQANRDRAKAYRNTEVGKAKIKQQRDSATAKEQNRQRGQKYRSTSTGKAYLKEYSIYYRYKLTLDEYNNIIAQQNNQCAICGQLFDSSQTKTPNIDHCHTTGKVRGILCPLCNKGLGNFKDNTDILRRAISYLEHQ